MTEEKIDITDSSVKGLQCNCGCSETLVVDTWDTLEKCRKRRRRCCMCGSFMTTEETIKEIHNVAARRENNEGGRDGNNVPDTARAGSEGRPRGRGNKTGAV